MKEFSKNQSDLLTLSCSGLSIISTIEDSGEFDRMGLVTKNKFPKKKPRF